MTKRNTDRRALLASSLETVWAIGVSITAAVLCSAHGHFTRLSGATYATARLSEHWSYA